MRRSIYRSAIAAAFLGTATVASAAELNLTNQQKQTIAQSVQTETGQPAPAGFLPRVGAAVPQSLTMRQLPSTVAAQVPAARNLEFAKLDSNEVLLIDPKDRRVAEIISPAGGTTGSASPMSPNAPMSPTSPASPR
jgi:hypothetical protein